MSTLFRITIIDWSKKKTPKERIKFTRTYRVVYRSVGAATNKYGICVCDAVIVYRVEPKTLACIRFSIGMFMVTQSERALETITQNNTRRKKEEKHIESPDQKQEVSFHTMEGPDPQNCLPLLG